MTVYLLLALKIFEEDKIAYVFDSSSKMSGTVASQIKTTLNAALGASKPLFQDFLLQQKFSTVSESIFNNESGFEAVIVFSKSEAGIYEKSAALEKTPQFAEGMVKALQGYLPTYFTEVDALQRLVRNPYYDERLFIFEKVTDEARRRSNVFLLIVRMSELSEMFRSVTGQKLYLISQDGTVMFGPDGSVGHNLKESVIPSILKKSLTVVSQGAETIKSKDGVDLLVSYSKVGFGDLIVINTVEKTLALSAVQVLIRKSLIFFGLLISLTVILSLFASSNLTQSLTQLFQATKRIAEGDFKIQVDVKSRDEVGILADNFNIMAAEVSRLLEQTAEKARMESELQTAKTVQDTLFPDSKARIGDLAIAGFYEPASECGGDWWHYCEIGSKIFLWIGDATGHGAPAALITSAAKSAATIIEKLNVSPAQALEMLNRSIYDVSKGRIMMTFFLASFDKENGELTYCNASHEAPFLLRKKEGELKKKDLELLNEVNNPRLGQARESIYKEVTVQIHKGDSVFFYTDGLQDIQNLKKESWGERNFIKALLSANPSNVDVGTFVSQFSQSFTDFRQGAPLVDDVTFFVVKNEGLDKFLV